MPNQTIEGLDYELVADIIRFSDGRLDPFEMANDQLRNFVERTVEFLGADLWGDRLDEVAEKYAPDVWKRWQEEDATRAESRREENRPLVWKEITVPAGSEVRMAYGGQHHYATVQHGHIVDDGKSYSPSEWAWKIANQTSRNAWRDLWFRTPPSSTWVPAQLLRERAREEAKNRVTAATE
jgi:hypothetical protein